MEECHQPRHSFLGAILAAPLASSSEPHFREPKTTHPQCKRTHFAQLSTNAETTLPLLIDKTDTSGFQKVGNRMLSLSAPSLLGEPATFEVACSDPHFTINPVSLGFIPRDAWKNDQMPFGMLVMSFFRKRNSMHCKFPFKLYNALRLTDKLPSFFRYVGIRWVTESVFLVDKNVFAKLIGVRTIDGSLFHQQGNFPSHGFVELTFQEALEVAKANGIGEVDYSNVRLLRHATGGFTRHCSEMHLHEIKWIHG